MKQDEFDMELSMLRVGVEDTGPGWECISPQQSRRLYVHVAMTVVIRSNISIVVTFRRHLTCDAYH